MGRVPRRRLADPQTALIALNVALLGVLGVVTLSPQADAQQGRRPRGEYMMLGGQITGAPANALHVIDVTNQEMITLRWDQSRKRFDGVGYRNLRLDAQGAAGGGR